MPQQTACTARGALFTRSVCDTTPRDGRREGRVSGWLEAATTAEASVRSLADDCVEDSPAHAVACPGACQLWPVSE